MGEVRRHFRDNSWSVKVPRGSLLHLRLGAATRSCRSGRAPTASELAEELGMDREEVVEGLIAGSSYNTLSIDSGGSGSDEDARDRRHAGRCGHQLDQIGEPKRCGRHCSAPRAERTVLLLRPSNR